MKRSLNSLIGQLEWELQKMYFELKKSHIYGTGKYKGEDKGMELWYHDTVYLLAHKIAEATIKNCVPKKYNLDEKELLYGTCNICKSMEADSGCNCQGHNDLIDQIIKNWEEWRE